MPAATVEGAQSAWLKFLWREGRALLLAPPRLLAAVEASAGLSSSPRAAPEMTRTSHLPPPPGVLTLIPRGTRPGLEIQPDESDPSSWQRIEKFMAEDEAILFGGLTLARLTGVLARSK
jgi:hypothetical protein